MQESSNVYDLLSKIDWEGGMFGVITSYGLRIDEYDIPEHLKEEWEEVAEAACSVSEDLDVLFRHIYEYSTKYGNKEEEDEAY